MNPTRLYILEGPDACGKTTLARKLSDALGGITMVHNGPFKKQPSIWWSFYQHLGRNTVMDRCWLSDPIYGEVYRKTISRVLYGEVCNLERRALLFNPVIIFCITPWEEAKARWLEKFEAGIEMLEDIQQYEKVWAMYQALSQAGQFCQHVIYDYTRNTADQLMEQIGEVS